MNNSINRSEWYDENFETKEQALANTMICLASGMPPEFLQKDEVKLIMEEYGDNWFERLGYSEPLYKKPIFD